MTPKAILTFWTIALFAGLWALWELPREGLPPVSVPVAISSGTHLVDNPEDVDRDVVRPLVDTVVDVKEFESVRSVAYPNSFVVALELQDELKARDARELLGYMTPRALPQDATGGVPLRREGLLLDSYSLLIAIRPTAAAQTSGPRTLTLEQARQLDGIADRFAETLIDVDGVDSADPFPLVHVPLSARFGDDPIDRSSSPLTAYAMTWSAGQALEGAAIIGVAGETSVDAFELRSIVDGFIASQKNIRAEVVADVSDDIRQDLLSLGRNVLIGLLAATLIATAFVSRRAAFWTVLHLACSLAGTAIVLSLLGVSLNTVSVLGLMIATGLILDDAIVVTDAIDRLGGARAREAVRRIAPASVAGSATTIAVFAPMLFVTGVLGEFVRQIPITVIAALSVSLASSLTVLPSAARLFGWPQTSSHWSDGGAQIIAALSHKDPNRRFSARAAPAITVVTMLALMVLLGPRIGFDIFPTTDDANELEIRIEHQSERSVEQASADSAAIMSVAIGAIEGDVRSAVQPAGNQHGATAFVTLTSHTDREFSASSLAKKAQDAASEAGAARVSVSVVAAGPPQAEFPFAVQVFGEDLATIEPIAQRMSRFLDQQQTLIEESRIEYTDAVARKDERRFIEVQARFEADVSMTESLAEAKALVENNLEDLGLSNDAIEQAAITFDFGQEDDNDEAFAATNVAFGVALLLIATLLVVQFRSIVGPLAIFGSVPLGIAGVIVGLFVTGHPLSFFVMLGLMGLAGVSVNNAILLADAVRRRGPSSSHAVEESIRERFRAVASTTLTTVVTLLPLALWDPFWQSLSVTIVAGLASSTLGVLLVLPSALGRLGKLRT